MGGEGRVLVGNPHPCTRAAPHHAHHTRARVHRRRRPCQTPNANIQPTRNQRATNGTRYHGEGRELAARITHLRYCGKMQSATKGAGGASIRHSPFFVVQEFQPGMHLRDICYGKDGADWPSRAFGADGVLTDAGRRRLNDLGKMIAYAARAVQFHPHGGQSRFRLAPRTYAPCGPSVRVDGLTKSRKTPTRNVLPLLFLTRYDVLVHNNDRW